LDTPQWELDQQVFLNFVLNELAPGSMDAQPLFLARSRLSTWSKALLAIVFNDAKFANQRTTLLSDLQAGALRSATGAHFQEDSSASWPNLVTPLYSTALVTYALARAEPASPLLPDLVRYLVAHRSASG
jgi:hypothetical protein